MEMGFNYSFTELANAYVLDIEAEMRQKIAEEIKDEIIEECNVPECGCRTRKSVLTLAADIAKGKYV
jgi:hypothetical protein